MIYSVCLYTADTVEARGYLLAMRDGGPCREVLQQGMHGYISSSVLQCGTRPWEFLVIHFFSSEEAYERASRSPEFHALTACADAFARAKHNLGVFGFPPSPKEARFGQAEKSPFWDRKFRIQ